MEYDYDIIVFDEEYAYAQKEIDGYGKALQILIKEYTSILKNIVKYSIKDELIAEELNKIIQNVEPLASRIFVLKNDIKNKCMLFPGVIDSADKFLY